VVYGRKKSKRVVLSEAKIGHRNESRGWSVEQESTGLELERITPIQSKMFDIEQRSEKRETSPHKNGSEETLSREESKK
jgi:hypothetical protein